ncbi:zinc-binding dehydrogenase [Pseudonocardia nematodicida]|uniref:Zinc-binding dehydrogenase n=1 Tax=Pseudonocardia nematodicida TaxID=1206997 RepID=A0ABV1K5W4_9PSEU
MRAAEIRDLGAPPVVADRPVPEPEPGGGAVPVTVLAGPITPLDLLCASGTSYLGTPATPYVPGVQGVGRAGGRLVWFPTTAGTAAGDGSMAGVALAVAEDVVELPAPVDPVAVAAAGLSAVAALQALTATGGLTAGETVVVLGAGGVVGQAAIQLARAQGAARVVAAARSVAARERAGKAGPDAVVGIDDADPDALTGALRQAAGGPVDLVLDPLFGPPAAAAARALRPGGRLVHLGSAAGETIPLDSGTIRGRSLRLLGYTNLALTRAERAAAISRVAAAVADGSLRVDHESVPLDDAAAAWERQAAGRARGRIVLTP